MILDELWSSYCLIDELWTDFLFLWINILFYWTFLHFAVYIIDIFVEKEHILL